MNIHILVATQVWPHAIFHFEMVVTLYLENMTSLNDSFSGMHLCNVNINKGTLKNPSHSETLRRRNAWC